LVRRAVKNQEALIEWLRIKQLEYGMKKFLKSFTSVLAGFAASQAGASVVPMENTAHLLQQDQQAQQHVQPASSPIVSVKDSNGDKFNFVLKRASDTGLLMAQHESHASHASHSSHSSHYSSRY
jgi:hypothetical protein